jgi:exopolysaccharide production protein ExoZ
MKENVQSIQFLRFVAATLVVIFHLVLGLEKYYSGSISPDFLYLAGFGAAGVHIFFVISGFVMVYTSFATPADAFLPSKFFIRRFIRIYPIYWVYATLYLAFHNTFKLGYSLSAEQIIGAYLLFPGDSANIVGPGWTLSFEVYFYLCFGIAMTLGLPRGLPLLTAFFLVLVAIRYPLGIDIKHQYLHVFTNSLLIEFLCGAWIAHFVVSKRRLSTPIAYGMILTGLAIFSAGCVIGFTRLPSVITWGIPSTLLVAGFVFSERNGDAFNFVRRYSWLGDSSYSLYLLHVLLIDITLTAAIYVHPHLASTFEVVAAFLLLLACYVLAGVIAFGLVERKLVKQLQSIANTRFTRFMGIKQPG